MDYNCSHSLQLPAHKDTQRSQGHDGEDPLDPLVQKQCEINTSSCARQVVESPGTKMLYTQKVFFSPNCFDNIYVYNLNLNTVIIVEV